MQTKSWSREELKQFQQNISSVHRTLPNGKVIWRKQAILDNSGSPVSLEQFLRLTGARRLRRNISDVFQKTGRDKQLLKAMKKDYKKSMKALFNNRSDWRKLSEKLNIHNVPDKSEAIKDIQKQLQ